MKYWVICDYRENLKEYHKLGQELYNDHPSIRNIKEIIEAIRSLGYECEYFGGIPELIHAIEHQQTFEECVFLNFTDGMDQNYSRVQAPALLEILGVPYSGSDVFPSVLMNNKHFSKQAIKDKNIRVAKSCLVNKILPFNYEEICLWKYPLFVKPNCEGSSLGISPQSVCHTVEEAKIRVQELLGEFEEVLIEEFIHGIDVTNYLIGNSDHYYINDVIVAELFDKSPYAIYDDLAKQSKARTLFFNDEKIPLDTLKKIKSQSIEIANIIGARDVCRIDYRLDANTQDFTFIEINSVPRFSSTSEIGFIASKRNLSFADMLEYYLLAFAERRKR